MAENSSPPADRQEGNAETLLESAILRPSLDGDSEETVQQDKASNEAEIADLAASISSGSSAQEFELIAQRAESLAPFPPNSRAYKLLVQALEKRASSFCDDVDSFLAARLDVVFARLIVATGFAKSKSSVHLIRKLCATKQDEAASRLIDALLRVAPLAQGYFNLTLFVHDEATRRRLQDDHFARLRELALTNEAARQQLALSLQRAGRAEDSTDPSTEISTGDESKDTDTADYDATVAAESTAPESPSDPQPFSPQIAESGHQIPEERPTQEQESQEQASEPVNAELETLAGSSSAYAVKTASHGDAISTDDFVESRPRDSGEIIVETSADVSPVVDEEHSPLEQTSVKYDVPNPSIALAIDDTGVVASEAELAGHPRSGAVSPDFYKAKAEEATSSEHYSELSHAQLRDAEEAFFEDRFDAAEEIARSALADAQQTPGTERMRLHNLIARCRIARGDGMGAIDAIKARANDCRNERQADDLAVQSLLAGGELEHAFLAYWADGITAELRACGLRSAGLQTLRQARSSGQKIKGTCGIVCTNGLGGEFRMMQMLPDIARLFDKLVVICDARAVETFQRNFPEAMFQGRDTRDPTDELSADYARFVDRKGMKKLRECDYVADLNQFAAIVRPSVTDFASPQKYVEASPWLRVKWELQLGMSRQLFPLLGLCWRQQGDQMEARLRQSSLSDWLSALEHINVRIVPLQADIREDEMALLKRHPRVVQLPEDFQTRTDIEDTLALLSALPLVVSVPGTIQEIAGAAGLRTLCPAHPFDARWRRRPGSIHDLWSASTIIISGAPDDGLAGSIARTAKVLADAVGR
jgi:hypothetical protein